MISEGAIVAWPGCYDEGWRDLIVPEAFAHPAKMSRGLVFRIFDKLVAIGALQKGDIVVDPFGGIGTTGIAGASRGVQVICCELEPRFVDLAQQNFDLHRRDWEAMGRPQPVIVQGDSRQLREHVGPALAACVVSSPPYSEGLGHGGGDSQIAHDTRGTADAMMRGYGDAPGQLGTMPEGSVAAVVSSPPYAEIASGSGGLNTLPPKHAGQQGGRSAESASQDTDARYGTTEGQLARLPKGEVDAIVSSPPWGEDATGHMSGKKWKSPEAFLAAGRGNGCSDEARLRQLERDKNKTYGDTDGQLSAMPMSDGVDAVVTSPPYMGEAIRPSGIDGFKFAPGVKPGGPNSQANVTGYGATDGQLGGLRSDETFWSAAKQIMQESYAILKPGGVAVWVVKAFVRDKQRVDFPGDWRTLCEHVGFETFLEVRASLVHEEVRSHLFDGEVTKRRERKSFFRRLAEKKGSPPIDWETVWFMRKQKGSAP